jgi:hypothetical protein
MEKGKKYRQNWLQAKKTANAFIPSLQEKMSINLYYQCFRKVLDGKAVYFITQYCGLSSKGRSHRLFFWDHQLSLRDS